MSYHPSTNDDTTSYYFNKINTDRRNQRKSTKYIQPIFFKPYPNKNNTNITSPPPKIQNRKLRQKKKIIPTIYYLHQHKNKSLTKHSQDSKLNVNNNTNPVADSTVINVDNTNVKGNHNNIGIDKEHNNRNQQNNNTNSHMGENKKLEENKYRSKINRHLLKIESCIKKIQIINIRIQTNGQGSSTKKPENHQHPQKHDNQIFKKCPKFLLLATPNTVVPI